MAFESVIRTLSRSPLTQELLLKLQTQSTLQLSGMPRLPKGLVASSLAQSQGQNLFAVCSTLEEAGRWATQLEAMGWKSIQFYPTSEASPYDPFDPESEMVWGQMQVLAELMTKGAEGAALNGKMAIVATERSLQPHLPPPSVFQDYCLNLQLGMTVKSKELDQ
jgi:transcription-repair coupling factor (superfamily II helicase)